MKLGGRFMPRMAIMPFPSPCQAVAGSAENLVTLFTALEQREVHGQRELFDSFGTRVRR